MNNLFFIKTYGCKLNQLDSERIREGLNKAGYEETTDPSLASFAIINSCAVTGKAEKESKYYLRKLSRLNPDAKKYFIGCFTTKENTTETVFLRGKDKFSLTELIDNLTDYPKFQKKHVRPLIEIQNGCNLSCSYCIVPKFRGKSISIDEKTIIEQINMCVSMGKAEVVLTGIHLGTWGQDLIPKKNISDLFDTLEETFANKIKIRVSSLDSNEISDKIIEQFANSKVFVPHFHIPLQSGSFEILKAMQRRYSPRQYLNTVTKMAEKIKDVCIGADVIVGFPGETEKLFLETYEFLKNSPLHYFHVFPFSVREGTKAATMENQVEESVKKERVKVLKSLSDEKKKQFMEKFVNKVREGVVIYPDTCLTDNYIQVKLKTNTKLKPSSKVNIKLNNIKDNHMLGEIV